MKKLLVVAVVLVAAGAAVAVLLNSRYWAAYKIGSVDINSALLNYAELKASLGKPFSVKLPDPSSGVRFRLEQNSTFDLGNMLGGIASLQGLPQFSTRETGPMILSEALDQAEVSFGRGIVRAGFAVRFASSVMLDDPEAARFLSAVWIEINPPFKGSLYGVHLGDPLSQAQYELRSRGAESAADGQFGRLLRDVTFSGPRGAEKMNASPVSGNLLSKRDFGVTRLILVECNEQSDRKPVTRITAWDTGYRTTILDPAAH